MAALQLTDQGRRLLLEGRADEAIRVLERALTLDSSNGQNYYFLSEAWVLKGDFHQAREFNRLAAIYLDKDPIWQSRVVSQRLRIQRNLD